MCNLIYRVHLFCEKFPIIIVGMKSTSLKV